MRKILAAALCFCFALIPMNAAWANEMDDLVAQMDPTVPKFQTPECVAARKAASAYDEDIGGRMAIGAILGATLGVFGLPIAAVVDARKNNEGQTLVNNMIAACGPEAFFGIYMQRAKDGHADAEAWVGQAYQRGYGCPQDITQAVYWYQKGADDGDDQARINLGAIYYGGSDGVPQDYAKAIALWKDAADDNHPVAERDLAEAYMAGNGVTQDYHRAIVLLSRSIRHGHPASEFVLGSVYESGKGVPQDFGEAYKWYSIAAQSGYTPAAAKRDEMAAKLASDARYNLDRDAARCEQTKFDNCVF